MQFTISMITLMAAALTAAAPAGPDTNTFGGLNKIRGWGGKPDFNWGGKGGWFPTCDTSCDPKYNPNCIRCNSPVPPAPGCDPQCNPLYNDDCVRCYPDNFNPPVYQCDQSCNPKYNPNCIRCNSPVQPLPGCDPHCNPLYNDNCPRCYPDWVH